MIAINHFLLNFSYSKNMENRSKRRSGINKALHNFFFVIVYREKSCLLNTCETLISLNLLKVKFICVHRGIHNGWDSFTLSHELFRRCHSNLTPLNNSNERCIIILAMSSFLYAGSVNIICTVFFCYIF